MSTPFARFYDGPVHSHGINGVDFNGRGESYYPETSYFDSALVNQFVVVDKDMEPVCTAIPPYCEAEVEPVDKPVDVDPYSPSTVCGDS